MNEKTKRITKRALGAIALVAGAYYIADAALGSVYELRQMRLSASFVECSTLFVGVVLTLMLSTVYHIHTVARIEPIGQIRLRIANAYSLGQIVRYIPGKIAGLIFQANKLSGYLKPSSVAIALIVQTVYDNAWTLVFAGLILASAAGHSLLAVTLLLPSITVMYLSHRRAWVERILLFPRFVRRRLDPQQLARLHQVHPAGFATTVLVLAWVPMFLALAVFLGELATPLQATVLGACYLLASIGSMLVFVVPSGMVVREALFVLIGTSLGVDQALLIYSGVALRLTLTAGEAACAIVFGTLVLASGNADAQGQEHP